MASTEIDLGIVETGTVVGIVARGNAKNSRKFWLWPTAIEGVGVIGPHTTRSHVS
jgi:hypothetical protein